MKQKRIRSILAILLTLVLIFVGIHPVAPEVKADELTPITWTDFGANFGDTYTSIRTLEYSGASLNNTALEGDIIFSAGAMMRYANVNGYFGMRLGVDATSGKFFIKGAGPAYINGWDQTLEFEASTFGLEKFADTQFTLKIEMREMTDMSALVSVYINGTQAGTEFTLTANDGHELYKLGKVMGFCVEENDTSITLLETKAPLTPITWTDFGANFGDTYTSIRTLEYSGASLNNTALEGDIIFSAGAMMRYANVNGYFGMRLGVDATSGKFFIKGAGPAYINGWDQTLEFEASTFGLKKFADTQFTLKIEMRKMTDMSALVSVYINGIQAGTEFTLTANDGHELYKLGKVMGFCVEENDTSVTLLETKAPLTPITWTDFGANYGETYTSSRTFEYSGESLNNTALEGDIIFSAGAMMRYANVNGYFGMRLGVDATSGKFFIKGAGPAYINGWDQTLEFEASTFGLKKFADTQFTLKIEMRKMTDMSALVSVYINGIQAGTEFTLTANDGHELYKLGKVMGFCVEETDTSVTLLKKQAKLTPITWETFGATSGMTHAAGPNTWDKSFTASGLDTLNNTVFKDDVMFGNNTTILYGGINQVSGLQFGVKDGNFVIESNAAFTATPTVTLTSEQAKDYGLTTGFVDTKFTLEIQMTELTETQAVVNVLINGKAVGGEIQLTSTNPTETIYRLGTKLYVTAGDITIPGENIPVPTNLTPLTWEEFGFTGGQTYSNHTERKALHLDNLNNTLFSGDIKMTAKSEFIYGASNVWRGVKIVANEDGTLTMEGTGSVTGFSTPNVNPKYYGLTSFVNQKFNIKIAITDWNGSYKSGSTRTVRVWINDQILGGAFTFTQYEDGDLGTTIHMSTSNIAITPYSSRTTVPSDLTEIYFTDWNVNEDLKYDKPVDWDGKINNYEMVGSNKKVDTLLGTTLNTTVEFVGKKTDNIENHRFWWGGTKLNSWYGICIYLNGDNMYINGATETGEKDAEGNPILRSLESFTIDPQTAQVESFSNTKFTWRIDTVQLEKNVLLYISFNGKLYNDAPFVFYDYADKISDTIEYQSINTENYQYETTVESEKADELNRYISSYYTKIRICTKDLPILYHDLSQEKYELPGEMLHLYEKNQAGDWEEVTTSPSTLSEIGHYKMEFNDGVSDYIQEVVCYYYEAEFNVASLVRNLNIGKNTQDTSWEEHVKRQHDRNQDGKVDSKDAKKIRISIVTGDHGAHDANEMRISGFNSPQKDELVVDATYQAIKGTGVNHIIESDICYSDDPIDRYRTYRELAYAQKYGIAVTVKDARLIANVGTDPKATSVVKDTTKEDVENAVATYKNYQSFDSLFIVDEPKAEAYPNTGDWRGYRQVELYTDMAQAIKNAGYKGWTNAFGGTAGLLSNEFSSNGFAYMRYGYYNYLNNLVDAFKSDYISFTDYPFIQKDKTTVETMMTTSYEEYGDITDMQVTLFNLALAKSVADTKGLEFRTLVAASAATESTSNPSYNIAQMKWHANMNLAFGADVLQYFPTIEAETLLGFDNECSNGLLDGDGKQTKFGEWATTINTQVTAIDEVLLNATHEGFMATGGYAATAGNAIKTIKLQKSWSSSTELKNTIYAANTGYQGAKVTSSDGTYGAFVGCFAITGGKHAMYIVNFSDVNANTVTVTLGAGVKSTAIYQGNETVHTGTFNVNLAAGEAVLVVY